MTHSLSRPCTAFIGSRLLACGPLIDVAMAIKTAQAEASAQAFDDTTGKVVDLDLRGTDAEIAARLDAAEEVAAGKARTRGRPKLGVVAREVTLLPRHWEWLAAQSGGASQALRRLVDEARRADGGQTRAKAAREAAYRFLSAMAGDLPGFEEATRALFAGDGAAFAERMADWPGDISTHALKLASLEQPGGSP